MISVIIPTYNRAETIGAAIESVLRQTEKGLEIIVVDDGSTDHTESLLSMWIDKIHYIKVEHRGLPARTRNIGIQRAKGEYIAFLDSDDTWREDKIERQLALFEKNDSVGLVCSNAYCTSSYPGKNLEVYFPNAVKKQGFLLWDLIETNFIITSTVMVRRATLEKVGGFSEDPKNISEDYELWLRIAQSFDIIFDPQVLVTYRRHSNQLSESVPRADYWVGLAMIYQNLYHQLRNQKKIDKSGSKLLATKISRCYRKSFQAEISSKHYLKAISVLVKHPGIVTNGISKVMDTLSR